MRAELREQYRSILATHLAGAEEAALLRAYDFTRQGLRDGLSPDEVMALHLDLVAELGQDAGPRAQGLLLEVVMAFSMAYQQAMQELKQVNEELEQLSSFKSRMLSMVAHDMMNHVVATKMVVQALRRDGRIDATVHPRLDSLLQVTDDEEHLIQNLLDLGRIESGRLQLELDNPVVNRLITRAVVKAQSGSTQHTFKVTGPQVQVRGDSGKLQQVLDNLVANAVKYSPGGGVIDIQVEQQEDRVSIAIRDEGLGIGPNDLPHLFEPFFRGKTGHGDIVGTGLGLSIVQSLVKMHGGAVTVESEAGHGSTFRFTLPALVTAVPVGSSHD